MSATATLTAADPQSTTTTFSPLPTQLPSYPSTPRASRNPSLNETKLAILSNISDALKHDIERKRHELAAIKTQQQLLNATQTEAPENLSSDSPISVLTRIPIATPTPAYCTYRPPLLLPPSPYRGPSPGRPCTCSTPHAPLRPQQWRTTPAEEEAWDYSLPQGGYKRERRVRFADDPVEGVAVFERWYVDEYVESERYWASGWVGGTEDWSTVEDDEWEVECKEAGWGEEDEVMEEVSWNGRDLDRGLEGADGGPLVRMA